MTALACVHAPADLFRDHPSGEGRLLRPDVLAALAVRRPAVADGPPLISGYITVRGAVHSARPVVSLGSPMGASGSGSRAKKNPAALRAPGVMTSTGKDRCQY